MKQQKNKIVFVLVMVCVVLFIAIYGIMTFGEEKKTELDPDRIPLPDVDGKTVEYESKMEALEAIKEEREPSAPQLYPDHMVDDKGYFNPDYMEYEKQRIIDSIYQQKRFIDNAPQLETGEAPATKYGEPEEERVVESKQRWSPEALGLDHQLFFASQPLPSREIVQVDEESVLAYVDGDQTVREGHRLNLRLAQDVVYDGGIVPEHTRIYGFVKIRPNRVMLDINGWKNGHMPMTAYDYQDGQEGIYVENHIKGEMVEKGMDETIGELNLPGMPQIGGLKRIFQRQYRVIKVDIRDKYQVTLKPATL